MTDDQLRKDAEQAHAIFDLCGIGRQTRGPMPRSLRLRAMILAEKAGVVLSVDMVDDQVDDQVARVAAERTIITDKPQTN